MRIAYSIRLDPKGHWRRTTMRGTQRASLTHGFLPALVLILIQKT